MLGCAMCGMPLRECCDLFKEVTDGDGNSVVVCADCADRIKNQWLETEAPLELLEREEDGDDV